MEDAVSGASAVWPWLEQILHWARVMRKELECCTTRFPDDPERLQRLILYSEAIAVAAQRAICADQSFEQESGLPLSAALRSRRLLPLGTGDEYARDMLKNIAYEMLVLGGRIEAYADRTGFRAKN